MQTSSFLCFCGAAPTVVSDLLQVTLQQVKAV
jgi:hypothetical protein